MREIKIVIAGKERVYSGPDSWEQVRPEMALKLFTLTKLTLTKSHYGFAIPMLVYGIPKRIMDIFADPRIAARNYMAENDNEDPETLALLGEELLTSCSWVYTDNPPSKWLLPTVELNGRFHDVCADRLHNLTFGEFIFAESYAANDPAKLAAVLYRKRNFFPPRGKRGEFVFSDVERFAQIWRKEKYNNARELIVWNYTGMINNLRQVFPDVFAPAAGGLASEAAPASSPWLDAAIAMSDNDSTKFRALEKEELYVVLQMLAARIKQNKEIQKQYRK